MGPKVGAQSGQTGAAASGDGATSGGRRVLPPRGNVQGPPREIDPGISEDRGQDAGNALAGGQVPADAGRGAVRQPPVPPPGNPPVSPRPPPPVATPVASSSRGVRDEGRGDDEEDDGFVPGQYLPSTWGVEEKMSAEDVCAMLQDINALLAEWKKVGRSLKDGDRAGMEIRGFAKVLKSLKTKVQCTQELHDEYTHQLAIFSEFFVPLKMKDRNNQLPMSLADFFDIL